MVKTDSKRLNVRLKTAARYALEDLAERWKCSQTAALERAILQAHESPFSSESQGFESGQSKSELTVEYDDQ